MMKRFKLLLLIVLFILSFSLVACENIFENDEVNWNVSDDTEEENENKDNDNNDGEDTHHNQTINFFTMNDIHGQLISDKEEGTIGLDRVTTILNNLEKYDDYIKLTTGDMFQGSYFSNTLFGLPGIAWLNYEHFDCFVLGNHEFDWGIEKIAAYKDGNLENGELNEDCEILGCNIYLKATQATPTWIKSYSIEECNGYKVGIVGCIGEGQTSSIAASKCKDYVFVDPVPLVKEFASYLRVEEECDCVIVAIHDYDQALSARFGALSGDSRIDAILCGHMHTENSEYVTRSDGYDVPVVQCRGYNGSVASINIDIDDEGNPVSHGKITQYNPSKYDINKQAFDLLNEYYVKIEEAGKRIIGYSSRNLSKETLGYMLCTSMQEKYDTEVSICNAGGIRSSISAGNISYNDVYKVVPFDNDVFIITMKGSDLIRALNSSLYCNVDSSSIDSSKTYKVSIISYVYENYSFFNSKSITCEDTYEVARDVLAEYISEHYPTK